MGVKKMCSSEQIDFIEKELLETGSVVQPGSIYANEDALLDGQNDAPLLVGGGGINTSKKINSRHAEYE